MFCPRCGASNGDEVIFCRGCGLDLVEVRVAVGPGAAEGQRRRHMRRGGLAEPAETPLAIEARAIELRSRGIIGLLVGGGFALLSYYIYLAPPIGGVFWLIPVVLAICLLGASIGRFVQASSLRALARREGLSALPKSKETYIEPRRTRFETNDLERPPSVTDATTRHLKANTLTDAEE